MSTIYGWAGKILRVNFTTGAITTEDTLPKYHDYVAAWASATRSSGTKCPWRPRRMTRLPRSSSPWAR